MKLAIVVVSLVLGSTLASTAHAAAWAKPVASVIPQAQGYIPVPNAAVMPKGTHVYRAIYNATLSADRPDHLVPALNMAGAALIVLAGVGLSPRNARFVVVFHGGALDAVLDDAHYRAKLANVDPQAVTPDVRIALGAQLVLMAYQNDGYALMSF
ncbi:MAG: hypothetical protein E6K80_05300 [Candidatus Eisenbacteria bacterium]|uniref:Uncharacterized protein n=1 Tax=Eiseniibacteriota bacterium TaxID=2212470 RepID=A0A538U6M8_UNCEI|nr:MAG: hypothetical protein E6K80_05300 [Candidatus Eisenbacteria bacterium]